MLSMTGYGRGSEILNGRNITVELKSVNSRYFEFSSRLPRGYSFAEDKLKKQVNAVVSRGKVELLLTVQNITAQDTAIDVNVELAKSYRDALHTLCTELELPETTSMETIIRFPDVLTVKHVDVDEEMLLQDIQKVCDLALQQYLSMKKAEGKKLADDISEKLTTLEAYVNRVEELSAGRVEAYSAKLYNRLQELLADRTVEDSRVVTEAAIFADKTAVDEETVRLHSHVKQYRDFLAQQDEPVGRKLDFLTQELNRETNTIGSKCQDLQITRIVVDMKSEIEKIREQIQNIE